MELREIQAIPITLYSDDIFKTSWLKVLTADSYFSIKLPTYYTGYRHTHLLNSTYHLEIEIIKTRKNWILKNINSINKTVSCQKYTDHIKLAALTKSLTKFIKEDQQLFIKDYIIAQIKNIETFNKTIFEAELLSKLGFSIQEQNEADQLRSTSIGRVANNLD